MKNMKNKLILSFILFITIFSFSFNQVEALEQIADNIYKNYNDIIMTTDEVNNLINLGFSEKEIYLMDSEEFNNNKNLTGQVVAETTKYYKTITTYEKNNLSTLSLNNSNIILSYSEEITEEEYNNSEYQVTPFGLEDGITETNYKRMTTTIISVNGRYRYKNTLYWKKMPATRSYDIMGIGIDSTVSGISSTKYFKRIADISTPSFCYYDNSTAGTWELGPTGYGITFQLPSNSNNYVVQGLEMYMYFEVQKLTSANIITLNAYGDYKHAQQTVDSSVSNTFSVGTSGISFDVSTSTTVKNSYDSISTAQATWSNINW